MPSPRLAHPSRAPAFRAVALPRWRAPRPKPGHVRLVVVLVVLASALAGGWLLVRDSSLAAVDQVTVLGASGPQAAAIRSALQAAGQDMTTLHVRPSVLEEAVAPFTAVKAVTATADFPHGLRVRVIQRFPVAVLVGGGKSVPVAGDGTLLAGMAVGGLPTVKLRLAPAGDALSDSRTLATVRLLATAPAPLRRKVELAFRGPDGLVLHLADGPAVHFGSAQRLTAKWAALTAVLASPASRGATRVDVRVPEHPAAAGLEQKAAQVGQLSTTTGG